jgi:hypothetical protein
VKPAPLFALACLAALSVQAQEKKQETKQETRIIERMQMPRSEQILYADPTMKNSAEGKMFDTKAFSGGKQISTREFIYEQKVRPKSFLTWLFGGTKVHSASDKKFATKEANPKGRYEIPNANTTLDQPTYQTNESVYADKKYATRDFATRQTEVRGTAQGSIDAQYQKSPMTIEQVRELLNKNR